MESLVIAFISLLLVLPIIYFLPLGFTRKGKLLILIFAFIVFIIGIAVRTVMSVWQIGLVLILLAIGFSYFIGKKFGTQLFLHVENNPGVEDKVIKFEIEDEVEEELRSQIKPKKENHLFAEQEIVSPPTQEINEEFEEENETTDDQSEDDFVLENVYVENEEPENTYELQSNDVNPVTDFDDLLKEIEMELFDKNSEIQDNDEIVEVSEETAEIHPIELDETEDEVLRMALPALEEVQFDSLQVDSEEPNEERELEEIPQIETIDDEPEEIEAIEVGRSEDENETEIEHLSSDVVDIINGENDIQKRKDNHNVLSQQLFSTMISQIRLSRNTLSTTQYENLIVDHLHPGISDHDYYTFVSLLIDHYLETKQYDELAFLISQNKNRFEKYPVILQEINFLLEEYCKI